LPFLPLVTFDEKIRLVVDPVRYQSRRRQEQNGTMTLRQPIVQYLFVRVSPLNLEVRDERMEASVAYGIGQAV